MAKYYVSEAESDAVRERLDGEDQVLLSDLARAELMGVFHRRVRERRWKRDQFLTVVRQFSTDELSGFWTWIPIDGTIVQQEIHTHDRHQCDGARASALEAVTIG